MTATFGGPHLPTDQAAFQSLFQKRFTVVWRFARRRCASSADADDVTAETFAVAWRRRHDIPCEQVHLWLFGIARRVIANQSRSARRQEHLRLRLVEQAVPGPTDERPSHDGTLLAALAALSPDDRDLLIMRAWDELPVAEMARLLDCSPNAVSVRLHKARRRLAVELKKDAGATGHVEVEPRRPKGGAR